MNRSIFRNMNEQINPSNELIAQTKSSMKEDSRKMRIVHSHKFYRYGATAACFVLIIAAAAILPKMMTNSNLPHALEIKTTPNTPSTISSKNKQNASQVSDKKNTAAVKTNPDTPTTISSKNKQNTSQVSDKKNTAAVKTNLSEKQIYGIERFGRFVPKIILPKYRFEEAAIYKDSNTKDRLSIVYTSGYNYIRIDIRDLSSQDNDRIVNVNDKEKYNITKYSIPLADSIPKELYETMNYPIFKADELTKDALLLRKFSMKEQGEGNGSSYVMNFSILCGDIVTQYNIKGTNLDDVFNMITSSEYFK